MTTPKAKPIELDCGHILWLVYPPTSEDETLWCARCESYQLLQQATVAMKGAWTYHPQWDFKSKRIRRSVYTGQCTFDECDFTLTNIWGFSILRNQMHSHYMSAHTNRGIVIEYADRSPRNSKPPF